MKFKAARTLLLLAGITAMAHAAPIFQISPATVSAQPGTTVGWGFTLTNTTGYLVITGSQFLPAPLSFFGSYQDLIGSGPLIVLGPAPEVQTLTEAFNLSLGTGVGAFRVAPTASGQLSGRLVVDYALFSVSPNSPLFNPDTDLLVADGQLSASATVAVVPEPASLLLLGPALLGLYRLRRTRREAAPCRAI